MQVKTNCFLPTKLEELSNPVMLVRVQNMDLIDQLSLDTQEIALK